MSEAIKMIAVVEGAPSAVVQDLFRSLVDRWCSSARIAGVIEEGHELADRACSAGRLRSIRDGSLHPIFQDLGPGSTACHLDGAGALSACEVICRDIAAGCDLVILSKFGKLEGARGGLAAAFTAAMEARVPLLTTVSPTIYEAWTRFAAPLFVTLPAERAPVEKWWNNVR
jgi:hypothetical protein